MITDHYRSRQIVDSGQWTVDSGMIGLLTLEISNLQSLTLQVWHLGSPCITPGLSSPLSSLLEYYWSLHSLSTSSYYLLATYLYPPYQLCVPTYIVHSTYHTQYLVSSIQIGLSLSLSLSISNFGISILPFSFYIPISNSRWGQGLVAGGPNTWV